MISKAAADVTINQCVDYTTVTTTQADATVAPAKPQAQLRTIHLYKAKGYGWLISTLRDSTDRDSTGGADRPPYLLIPAGC